MGNGREHDPQPRGDGEQRDLQKSGNPAGEAPREGTPQGDGGEEVQEESWDDLVLDERFIREAEMNEPAARTRMLQERWRESPPEPAPWRADAPPAGWFFSKSRRQARRRKRRGKD